MELTCSKQPLGYLIKEATASVKVAKFELKIFPAKEILPGSKDSGIVTTKSAFFVTFCIPMPTPMKPP